MPQAEFERGLKEKILITAVPSAASTYIEERVSLLRQTLDQTNALARDGQLPDVELTPGLKISPLENNTPKEADELRERLYGMLPHVKITDLLLEVDNWTGFTRCFTHLKTSERVKDPVLLLTAILADATNLGLAKMAESCPGTSPSKLSRLVAWHIGDETYSKALASIVNHHHRLPFAALGRGNNLFLRRPAVPPRRARRSVEPGQRKVRQRSRPHLLHSGFRPVRPLSHQGHCHHGPRCDARP
jgi:hypothetical protein